MELSVIVPILDEVTHLDHVLSELRSTLNDLAIEAEILVVSVVASDQVRAAAGRAGAIYLSSANAGYGAATLQGVAAAQGDYILTLDPDAAYVQEVVSALWNARGQGDVVVGSRYTPGARVEQPWMRQLLSRGMNAFFSRVLSTPIRDLSSGIRIHRRGAFGRIRLDMTSLAFLLESLLKWFGNGVHVCEIPIHYRLHGYRNAQAHGFRLGVECLRSIGALWGTRNSVECADYDLRAYDSRIPLQRYWQRARHHLVMRFAVRGVPTIDVGCGSGRIIADLPEAVGVDIRYGKLYFMSTIHRRLVQAEGLRLPFPNATFGCVICSEVIEHIPEENGRLVAELVRILAPGGTLVLGTPDYGTFWWNFFEWLYRRVAPNAYGHEHVTHYTYQTLRDALIARGLDVVEHGYVCRSVLIFKARKA